MGLLLRAVVALPEVQCSIPSNCMVAHNHLQWYLMSSSGLQVYVQQNTHTLNKYNKKQIEKKNSREPCMSARI
jgi:NMD protein affecting ribosome stability and mRNA decay